MSTRLRQAGAEQGTSTGQELLRLKGRTDNPVFSPDGKLLASSGRDGTTQICDATPLPEKP